MIYTVICDDTLLYDPRVEELALINPTLNLEENRAGSFSFKMPPKHPMYDKIQRRTSIITVFQDNVVIFSGTCIEQSKDFYNQKTIYCEGELAFLNDSIQRPARYQNVTVRNLLTNYINNHNAQVDDYKKFEVGAVTVKDSNDSLYCYTNMESTMLCLKEDLVDDLGGFFRVRHEDGKRYIDYLEDSMNTNSQIISIGENLLDFTSNIDSSEIATAIIPLGATKEKSDVEGLETRLTIAEVNGGIDYVHSPEAVAAYGWIYKTVIWDDVTTASALKKKGQEYLNDIQFENMVITAKAIDLNLTDSDIEAFKLSDKIRVVSAPHGLDRYFRLTKMVIYLNSPQNNTITLGRSENISLSAKTAQANVELKKATAEIVPKSAILQEARDNATAMINSAMGGYVVKTQNELLIMDTNDTETATKVWRWNMNGLGYSYNGYKGPYETAITADGRIVADFITTGVLSAVIIKSGILKSLDGTNYFDLENGVCQFNGTFIAEKDLKKLVLSVGALKYYVDNKPTASLDNVENPDFESESAQLKLSTKDGDASTSLDAFALYLGEKNDSYEGLLCAGDAYLDKTLNAKGKITTESKVVCEGVMASGEVSCKDFISTGNAYFTTLQSDKINAGGTTRSIGWKQVKDTSGNTIYVLAAT